MISSEEQITLTVASINDGPSYIGGSDRFYLDEDFWTREFYFDFNDEFNDVDLILDESENLTYTLEYNDDVELNEIDADFFINIGELQGLSQNLNISSSLDLYSDIDDLGNFESTQITAVATDANFMYAQNTFEVAALTEER